MKRRATHVSGELADQDRDRDRDHEPAYQVLVRFDDGERGLLLFRDYSPFAPGARVVLSPRGLRPGR